MPPIWPQDSENASHWRRRWGRQHSRHGPQSPMYSNPYSQQQMRFPHVEAVGGLTRPLSLVAWLPHGWLNELPLGATTRHLNDMMTTPFAQHILMYKPLRGYTIPKFVMYDGTYDPFDHLMHYRQMMTLDIDNDELLCKVFPASL